MEILNLILFGIIALGIWLGPKYLIKRVEEAARGAVDVAVGKALADYEQPLAKDRERYSRDYALFAEKRNHVYAETYAALETAVGHFAPFFAPGLSSHPDISRLSSAEANSYLESLELLSDRERSEAKDLINSNLGDARRLLSKLYQRDALRRAQRMFVEFKNLTIINALYFDPLVEEASDRVRVALAAVASQADLLTQDFDIPFTDRIKSYEKIDSAVNELRQVMRQEMRAGFASPQQSEPSERGSA